MLPSPGSTDKSKDWIPRVCHFPTRFFIQRFSVESHPPSPAMLNTIRLDYGAPTPSTTSPGTDQYWAPQYLPGKFLAEILADKENQEMHALRIAAKPPNPAEALAIAVARGEVLQKSEEK